jgi:uncharacterized protein (TIGR02246 family)
MLVYSALALGVACALFLGLSDRSEIFEEWNLIRPEIATPIAAQASTRTAVGPRWTTPTNVPRAAENASGVHEALFQTGDMFIRACREQASHTLETQVAAAAEFIDKNGNVYRGRDKVVEAVAGMYSQPADARLETQIESIRFVSPTVAIEDGTGALNVKSQSPVRSRYTVVHVKTGGKWVVASLRENAVTADQ